jgi:hypothetical protein
MFRHINGLCNDTGHTFALEPFKQRVILFQARWRSNASVKNRSCGTQIITHGLQCYKPVVPDKLARHSGLYTVGEDRTFAIQHSIGYLERVQDNHGLAKAGNRNNVS